VLHIAHHLDMGTNDWKAVSEHPEKAKIISQNIKSQTYNLSQSVAPLTLIGTL